MSTRLGAVADGLRAHLSEAEWSVVAAMRDAPPEGAFVPIGADAGTDEPRRATPPDEALVAAAGLALGDAPVQVELVTGADHRGLVARIGCDQVATGIAVRALVPAGAAATDADDDHGPVAVPGVEIGANRTSGVVAEIMRLFPDGGTTRHAGGTPVTLPHELALTLHHALSTGDERLAQHVAEQAGRDAPPDVLVSLAAGTTASATLTVRVAGSPTTVVQQWLLCDVGWVLLTVHGTRVTHTAQSRDEVRDTVVRLMAGALTTAVAGHG